MDWNREETGRYDDIIDLPYPVPTRRPRMPRKDRAAQFSPFAALSGHADAIRETARLTQRRAELDESYQEQLDARLRELLEDGRPVTITWFRPDDRKEGGSYATASGTVKKIDAFERCLFLEDGTRILLDEIVEVL